MTHLEKLASAYQTAKAIYDACPFAQETSTPEEMVRIDMVRRIALKRMNAAESAYHAALDLVAEKQISESTVVGIAAE